MPDALSAVAAAGEAAPIAGAVVTGLEAALSAIKYILHEAELARTAGEVVTGEELVRRSAVRLDRAAADPGLPPEVRPPASAPPPVPPSGSPAGGGTGGPSSSGGRP